MTELRRRGPLFPFSIFRIHGLGASDVTQMIAFAGFVAVFFFLTLYMQNVLGFSPIRGGARLPAVSLSASRMPRASPPGCSPASEPALLSSPAR